MCKKQKLLLPLPALMAVILEASPHSALLRYQGQQNGEFVYIDNYLSYFDVATFGAGSFGPFPTAVLTVLLFIAAVVLLFKGGRRGYRAGAYLAGAAAVFSLLPLTVMAYTLVGLVITMLLALECYLLWQAGKQKPPAADCEN